MSMSRTIALGIAVVVAALTPAGAATQIPCSSMPQEAEEYLPMVLVKFTDPGRDVFRQAIGVPEALPPSTPPETLFHLPAVCQEIFDKSMEEIEGDPLEQRIAENGYHHFIGKYGPYSLMVLGDGPFFPELPEEGTSERVSLGYTNLFVFELEGGVLTLIGRALI